MAERRKIPINEAIGFVSGKERIALGLYGQAGTGKSTTVMSLVKNPELTIFYLALEPNALPAIKSGLAIHAPEGLYEGQFYFWQYNHKTPVQVSDMLNVLEVSGYSAMLATMVKFIGTDIATGKEAELGNILAKKDVVLVLDSATALMNKAGNSSRSATAGNKDGRAFYGAMINIWLTTMRNLFQSSKCHIIITAHTNYVVKSDEAANEKLQLISSEDIIPNFGSRTTTDMFCGNLSHVYYCYTNPLNRPPYLLAVGGKPDGQQVYLIDRCNITNEKLAEQKVLHNADKPATTSKMLPDLTLPVFNWAFSLKS
jgi:hypothetical protein